MRTRITSSTALRRVELRARPAPDPAPPPAKLGRAPRLALAASVCAALLTASWNGWLPGTAGLHPFASAQMQRWRIFRFSRGAADAPEGAVVFLGSSTVYRFPLETAYPGVPCLNRGLGSETTNDLLVRLDASLPVARPSGVVIYTGSNDVRDGIPPWLALVSVDVVMRAVEARFPGVPMAVVEVLPVVEERPWVPQRLAALNAGLRELARSHGAAFVPTIRPPLVDEGGRLVPAMSCDGLHLNEAGYEVFAAWIAQDGGAATASLRRAPAPLH